MKNVKKRVFEDKNYSAIYCNGKTIRIPLDSTKPVLELNFPEFYDVKITGYCSGNCHYCYQDSTQTQVHYEDIIKKTVTFFGPMTKNERPFQVALGGGNPNEHPDFKPLLASLDALGIVPNYTTNGIGLTDEIIKATKKYCGGVAVTCHEHLDSTWRSASKALYDNGIMLNFHNLISDKKSVDNFIDIYNEWKDKVDYFVLLPLLDQGRSTDALNPKVVDNLFSRIKGLDESKIAFGANFYPYLKDKNHKLSVSLYEPEILSKYLDLKDMKIYKSSFHLEEVQLNR